VKLTFTTMPSVELENGETREHSRIEVKSSGHVFGMDGRAVENIYPDSSVLEIDLGERDSVGTPSEGEEPFAYVIQQL
jgi:hypothetical protein